MYTQQDNGLNEFVGVCNVTFKGFELAGSFTKNSAKAFLQMCKFLMTATLWGKNKVESREYNKSGKKSQKVIKDKFQGQVLYGKIENVQEMLKQQEKNNTNFSKEQLDKLPNSQQIKKWFDQYAKTYGLEYCVLPNKFAKEQKAELFLQYPKAQEGIYQEVVAEVKTRLKKECEKVFQEIDKENEKKCEEDVRDCKEELSHKKKELKEAKEQLKEYQKIGDKVGEQKYGEIIGKLQAEIEYLKTKLEELVKNWNVAKKQTGKDLMETLTPESKETLTEGATKQLSPLQYLEQSGLLQMPEQEFDALMQQTFPKEYEEVKKSISQVEKNKDEISFTEEQLQQKKKDLVKHLNRQTKNEAKKTGNLVDFKINAKNYVKCSEDMVSFPHPEHKGVKVTIGSQNICGFVDDSKRKINEQGKSSGTVKLAVYKDTKMMFEIPILNPITGKNMLDEQGKPQFVKKTMTYTEFDKHVKEIGMTAATAMWKKQQEVANTIKQAVPLLKQKGK